jgi:hypothetical protein
MTARSKPVAFAVSQTPRLPVPERDHRPAALWPFTVAVLLTGAIALYAVHTINADTAPPVIVQAVAPELPTFSIRLDAVLYLPTETATPLPLPTKAPTMIVTINDCDPTKPEPGRECVWPKPNPTATALPYCPRPSGGWCVWPVVQEWRYP